MPNILDCTLRDGGYYTNWDFESGLVNQYIAAINRLPVTHIEVGYRNKPTTDYMGKFAYTPVSFLRHIKANCTKKIAVMVNEKSTLPSDLPELLEPIAGLADMVRIAIDPANFERAVILAEAIKEMGFEVACNVMYMSLWDSLYEGLLKKLHLLNGIASLFCMVDSFGGITPDEVKRIFALVKGELDVPIGFHGHNNLQLGLINSLSAIDSGIDYVDATILGMGRGAGNLNLELLLTYLNAHKNLSVDFNALGSVVSAFTPLMEKYHWGTSLPYMLSGANNIPQKEVMEWVSNRRYSFNSIVRALDNRKNHELDNARYPVLTEKFFFEKVLIIGGGSSVISHKEAIKEYLESHPKTALIFATSRHAGEYVDLSNPTYYVIVGDESRRLCSQVTEDKFKGLCVLPPYPRKMGTEIPSFAQRSAAELSGVTFSEKYTDSVTAVALQLAAQLLKPNGEVLIAGYDGYPGNILSEKEVALTHENQELFLNFKQRQNKELLSITPSLYRELTPQSIYGLL